MGDFLELKIITVDEHAIFFKALNSARKASVEINRTDEDRLKNMELYLNMAQTIITKIRERWQG